MARHDPRPARWKLGENFHEGKYRVQKRMLRFDQVKNRFRLEEHRLDKDTRETKEGDIPPNVFDILGSFLLCARHAVGESAAYRFHRRAQRQKRRGHSW